ncbi:hypothetical protein MYA_1704 [Burkholderia sp. KJ006]|nr:hypothetical protein MYA_1704 [Burkholderia sp. KJ006]
MRTSAAPDTRAASCASAAGDASRASGRRAPAHPAERQMSEQV